MPGYSEITTLVTPGGTITFNAASGDTYFLDPDGCSGLIGTGEIRNPVDNKGQTSGFLVHTFFEQGARGVLAGQLHCDSAAARNAMQDTLKAALRSILTTTGTLNFTGGQAIVVKFELGLDFPQISGIRKGFRFGLVGETAL